MCVWLSVCMCVTVPTLCAQQTMAVQVGDRVRLISGSYAGETGMVLQTTQDTDQCIVISDTTKEELRVFGR